MLSLREVCVSYGPVAVLKGITLKVEEGEVVTLIGANGAGKTTTLMAVSGIVGCQSGTITFCGEELRGLPPHRIVEKGICHVPEGRRIFPRLSVLENLQMGAYLHRNAHNTSEAVDHVYSLFPILQSRRDQLGGTLSGGEQQMLAIGRALMLKPKLLILDEPSLGLSPLVVEKVFEMIQKVSKEGTTIFLVEQNARSALALADRGYVIETGQIVLSDRADRLMENRQVQSAYLGSA